MNKLWALTWADHRLQVMPVLAVEARNVVALRDNLPERVSVVLGVYQTEHDAKAARREMRETIPDSKSEISEEAAHG